MSLEGSPSPNETHDKHFRVERTGDQPESDIERKFQDCVDLVAGAEHVTKEMRQYILESLASERSWRAYPPNTDEVRVPALWERDANKLVLLQDEGRAYIFDQDENDNWWFRIPSKREIEQGRGRSSGYNPETGGDHRARTVLETYEKQSRGASPR